MKFIFDFDDVLFNNTKQFKEHMYMCLEKFGVPHNVAESYYKEVREKEFSMKDFISTLLIREKVSRKSEEIYKEIMSECKNFLNVPLLKILQKLGKNNCYLISNGDKKFQENKIENSGITSLFSEIHIVPSSKKEIIENICRRNKKEQIIFVDDKIKFFEDLNMTKCPNLKTILYDEHGLEKLKKEINNNQ